MKKGWAAELNRNIQNENYTSFIGGRPRIPDNTTLPKCHICGEPLVFFFQVDFPKSHLWEGKTLAMFACIHGADKNPLKAMSTQPGDVTQG